MPLSVYIHIPYCHHKCPYCDFNTYVVKNIPEDEYVDALVAEYKIRIAEYDWSSNEKLEISTIYFGGGTPSIFKLESIEKIFNAFSGSITNNPEITIEVNPGEISIEKLQGYYNLGINRLSFGSQSFNDIKLRNLGRVHKASDTRDSIELARKVGFNNINLDLIYATPNEDLDVLSQDLEEIINTNVEHVSAYGLTLEKGTPFYQRYKTGSLTVPDEELATSMLLEVDSKLHNAGFSRYEISNYAKPGKEAKHNMAYWQGKSYLGLGAGAHSLITRRDKESFGRRWANTAKPENYISAISSSASSFAWREDLSLQQAMFETIFLRLRLTNGLNIEEFNTTFQNDFSNVYGSTLENLLANKLVTLQNNHIQLTINGLLLADSVIESFANIED